MDYSRERDLWVTPDVFAVLNPIAAEMSDVWRSEAPHLSLRAL